MTPCSGDKHQKSFVFVSFQKDEHVTWPNSLEVLCMQVDGETGLALTAVDEDQNIYKRLGLFFCNTLKYGSYGEYSCPERT
jgi:hypothetical protein